MIKKNNSTIVSTLIHYENETSESCFINLTRLENSNNTEELDLAKRIRKAMKTQDGDVASNKNSR